MYANRKEWELGQVEVAVDFETPTRETSAGFAVKIRIPADLSDEQREKLLAIAAKCPVHRTLAAQDVRTDDSLETIEA
jgi:putative redox protein